MIRSLRFPSRAALALFAALVCAAAPARAAADSGGDRAAKLDAVYRDYWQEYLKLNPLQATQIGDTRYNDLLPNSLGPSYRERARAFHQRYLERARKIGADGLTDAQRISYDQFVYGRETELAEAAYPRHLIPINQFYNLANQLATLGSGTTSQPFKTVADYRNWLKRAGHMPELFDQAIANMRLGIKEGVVQPKVLIEKVLPQLDQQIVAKPEDSTFWGPIKNMPSEFPPADKERLTRDYSKLITATLVPNFRKLRAFLADEYLPRCRDTVGLWDQPDGAAWYAFLVRRNTTTELTPDQIHQIGLDEVARIHGEMQKVMDQVGFKGTLKEYFAAIKADPKQYFATETEMLEAYRGFRATVEPLLPTLFDIEPKADFEIRAVEAYRAQSASGGQYNGPSADGTRPGIFYVNTYDLKARPRYGLESLYLHEAQPGHHFQVALQRELTDVPDFRRFSGETAFSEGWGLYAESLGKELGVYTDPTMYFGMLDAELWRSIRLVTDTGVHAKRWTRQQMLDYMYANSPVEPTRAISEAERFMAIPGQALAYKIGQRKIRELRTRAEQKLGDRFNVRAFHTEVLKDGSLPLAVLEAKIDRWIAAQN